jgi:nitrogen fixation protein NifU and related proteins
MDAETKREIILENYERPVNKQSTHDEGSIKVNSNNESCIDNIDLYITFKNDLISNITFDGEACAISTSSTSIMITNLIGKTISEAKKYIANFEAMINEENYNAELLNEALAYDEIYKQKSRKTCATLPYVAIKKAIAEYEKTR